MRHGAKRLLALLTVLVMVCSSATVSASATDDVTAADPDNVAATDPDNATAADPGNVTEDEILDDPDIHDTDDSAATCQYGGVDGATYGPSGDKPAEADSGRPPAADTVTVTAPANTTEDESPGNSGISGAAKEEVRVYPPKSIIYGEELGYPSTQGYTGSTFTFEYEGVEGTVYGPSKTKPTEVGSYRVIASLNGNKWYSDPFTITYPLVTLSASVQNQTKYIFANSEYNSLERMPEVADTITGTYNGRTVTLIPEWKKPGGLFNSLKGSQGNGSTGYFGANEFTAATFTVKGTGERVQAAPGQKVILWVWVIAVDAMLNCDGYTDGKIIVTKSQALAVQSEEDLQRLLNLPTQAKVTYQPEEVKTGTEDLTKKAQDAKPFNQADDFYNITGWEMVSYNENLNAERLRNLAGEVTNDKNKTVTLWANCENPPEWAIAKQGEMSFSLTITPDSPAQVTVTPPGNITYGQPLGTPSDTADGDEETDDIYLKNGYFITIYANSQYNQSKESLLKLVQERKGSYTFNGTTHKAAWSADSGNRAFQPKGYEENVWYNYTAVLEGSSQRPHAHVRVIPVNATSLNFNTSTSFETVKASDVNALTEQDWKDTLGLPAMIIFKNKPAQEVDAAFLDKRDEFPINDPQSGCYTTNSPITGWKMDGKDLTLTALKSKAASTVNGDVVVTLTPVYQAMEWATVKGSAPAFQLTITPKIPVDVKWDDGPASPITYGEMLNFGTPDQVSKDGGSIDETTGFSWQYIYYKEDGTRLGQMQPTNVGIYKVQAVLISRTHSGASVLKEFEIKAKSIDGAGVTFTPPADIGSLTYNKRPQTPVYTVKDGEKALRQNTDYRVSYRDNTNAGTAKVTFTGTGNYTGTTEKTFTIQKLPLTVDQKPVISGTAASGQVLSASLDGVDAAELEWSWTVTKTAGTNSTVVGDNTASYEVRPEDSNKIINVTAKAKGSGNYSGISGASDGKLVEKLKVAGIVTVTAAHTDADGRIEVGTILTANASVIPSNVPAGFWQWKVNGIVKEHNVNNTYTVESGDKDIIAVFVPVPDYTGSIESAAVEVGRILLTGAVSAAKDPVDSHPIAVGSRLKAVVNGGTASGIFTYTWLRDGKPISGADGEEYRVIAADRGKTISVKATADGYTGELVSGGTNVPAARPGAPTNVKVIAGDQLLDISWSDPADNGGAPVTGYRLKVMQGANVVLERVLAANVLSYKLEGLTNGLGYIVNVGAFNRIGDGEVYGATATPRVSGGDGNGNAGGNGNGNAGGNGNGDTGNNGSGNTGGGANGYIGGNGNGYTGGGKAGKASGTPCASGGNSNVGFTSKAEQNGRIFTHTNDEKSNDPEKTTDGISQRRNEANLILGLAILGISGIGMMIALLNKRRKYREKLFR